MLMPTLSDKTIELLKEAMVRFSDNRAKRMPVAPAPKPSMKKSKGK